MSAAKLHFEDEEVQEIEGQTVEAGQSASNSLYRQKQLIKKRYAAAKRKEMRKTSERSSKYARRASEKAAEETEQAVKFLWKHRRGVLLVLAIFLLVLFLMNTLSSCSMVFSEGGSVVALSTYPSEDGDMLGAETAYCALEADLQATLDSYEASHDYDEYVYELDDMEHDPYVLISLVTAWYGRAWTLSEAQAILQMLFDRQYTLSESVVMETRARTVTDPETGEESEESYPYTICTVKLENFNLSHIPVYIFSEDQMGLYATYMATLGNRPDLFADSEYTRLYGGPVTWYEIPPEALSDEKFAAMIREAEKYLGYPYVWGGASPSTSFDCSGFVSWVINHCGQGWDFGRRGTDSLYFDVCTPIPPSAARPGDLIFFQHTYDTPNTSHVGIYVGGGMMIHCGDPIQYTSIETSYWQEHFYGFGRLP